MDDAHVLWRGVLCCGCAVLFWWCADVCGGGSWRAEIAIPRLLRAGVPFFNPQIADWNPSLIEAEAAAKASCPVLLFVIDSQTRAIASMLEATENIMCGRMVVLVVSMLPDHGAVIDGQPVRPREFDDLNRARLFLCDIAARHPAKCSLFESVEKVAVSPLLAVDHAPGPNLSPPLDGRL